MSDSAAKLLHGQFQFAHQWLEGTMEGVTNEVALWQPQGNALPIGAEYAHVVVSEDALLNGLGRGGAPLCASSWAGKVGLSELPPQAPPWDTWARNVQVDIDALRAYGRAVWAETDAYLATLTDADLAKPFDLSFIGMGMQPYSAFLSTLLLNVYVHSGEISCVKGLQGLKGYAV